MDISIVSTTQAEVTEELAKDLADTYNHLSKAPVTSAAVVDFATPEDARRFVKQGKAWASTMLGPNGRPLVFSRRGKNVRNDSRVMFRIYEAAEKKENKGE